MRKIYYIALYDTNEWIHEKRRVFQSGINKANTVINALNNLGWNVNIISMSTTLGDKRCPARICDLSLQTKLYQFACFGRKGTLSRITNFIWLRLQLVHYVSRHIKNNDIVIVYHNTEYPKLIYLLKKLLCFKMILELEEIYADVNGNERLRKKENHLIDKADAFIFPTEKLNERVNRHNKPFAIVYGPYMIRTKSKRRNYDNIIHVVYAGTFNPQKGVLDAIKAAGFLSEEYTLHILGNGSENEITIVKKTIGETIHRTNASIMYEGEIKGESFYDFLEKCDIGLCPQDPNALFTDTSFPSKVLTYLSCGLRVVSIKIPSISESKIGDMISFYSEQDPQEIANTIRSVDLHSTFDYVNRIIELKSDFEKSMSKILENI